MLIAYNAKNKYRLPIKKLYGNQRDEELDDEESDDDVAMMTITLLLFCFHSCVSPDTITISYWQKSSYMVEFQSTTM